MKEKNNFLNDVTDYLNEHNINLKPSVVKKSIFNYLVLSNDMDVVKSEIKIKPITIEKETKVNTFNSNACHSIQYRPPSKEGKTETLIVYPYKDTKNWLKLVHNELLPKHKDPSIFKFF